MGAGLGQFPARSDQIRTSEHKLLLGGQVSHLENIREDQIGTLPINGVTSFTHRKY